VVNIGSDRETKIIDVARAILKITGSNSPLTYHPLPQDDPLRRRPDITRANELLGWRPKVTLEEGSGALWIGSGPLEEKSIEGICLHILPEGLQGPRARAGSVWPCGDQEYRAW